MERAVASQPAIAFDGSNYLVVWRDTRKIGDEPPYYFLSDLKGTRVTPDGLALDVPSLLICESASYRSALHPVLAFKGDRYLLAWTMGTYPRTGYLNCVQMDKNGGIVNTVDLTSLPEVRWDGFDVVANNSWSLLTYEAYESDLCAVRIDLSGAVLDADSILVCNGEFGPSGPSVACGGGDCYVAWEDYRNGLSDVFGTLIKDSGEVAVTDGSDFQYGPGVTSSDGHALVAWSVPIGWGLAGMRVARVDPTMGVANAEVDSTFVTLDDSPPVMAFNQHKCLLVWSGPWYTDGTVQYGIFGARLTSEGSAIGTTIIQDTLIAPETVLISAEGKERPGVAVFQEGWIIGWADSRNGDLDIYAARVDSSGALIDPDGIEVSVEIGTQGSPTLASVGNQCLIVWEDDRDGTRDVFGARIDHDGIVLDSEGILIMGGVGEQSNPSVAFDGQKYIVVWEDNGTGYNELQSVTVSQSGLVENRETLLQYGADQYVDYAPRLCGGPQNRLLLTFNQFSPDLRVSRISGTLVSAESTNRTPTFIISHGYPNPFRDVIRFDYDTGVPVHLTARIYDVSGRLVRNLHSGRTERDSGLLQWDGATNSGDRVSSGVYFIRMNTSSSSITRKAVRIK